MALLTFEIIEIQAVQQTVASMEPLAFQYDSYDFGCEPKYSSRNGEPNVAKITLFLSSQATMLGELRLFLLALALWAIGKSLSDVGRTQQKIATQRASQPKKASK